MRRIFDILRKELNCISIYFFNQTRKTVMRHLLKVSKEMNQGIFKNIFITHKAWKISVDFVEKLPYEDPDYRMDLLGLGPGILEKFL